MKKYIMIALLGTAMILPVAADAQAKKMKEIETLVGYNVTTVTPGEELVDINSRFDYVDANNDGVVSSKEFMNKSNADDSYERFLIMDANKDKQLTIAEYQSYTAGKGLTTFREGANSNTRKNWNVKKEPVIEKKFVPVEDAPDGIQ